MSGENLLSDLPVWFYYDDITETKKIIYLKWKFKESSECIDNIPELA